MTKKNSALVQLLIGFMVLATPTASVAQTLRHIQPENISEMPSEKEMAEWKALNEQASDENADLPSDVWGRYEELMENPILDALYSGHCSWYCGGEVQRVTASSHLAGQGKFSYQPKNAHDFNHESVWAEGAKGQGVGEWLDYEFAGACPRITRVCILSGHVKTPAAWQDNSRPKQLKMYYMGKPYAILELKDIRGLQEFDVTLPLSPAEVKKAKEKDEYAYEFIPLGYHDASKPNWHLRFEIMSVYPGTKYEDTVISELYFDGIDVH